MQLPVVAALLFAPPAAEGDFCSSLKQGIASAPQGFAGLPSNLFGLPYAGEAFICSAVDSREYDAEAPPHRDLVCETPLRAGAKGAEPKDSIQIALRGDVARCLGRPVDPNAFIFETPRARVEVTGSFVVSTSRIGPAPPALISTALIIHAKP